MVQVSDLVSRLLAKLDEVEQKAATGVGWHTPECGFDHVYHARTCTCPVPAKVLRLCQAHREFVGKRQEAINYRNHLNQQRAHGAIVMAMDGAVEAWDDALKIIAAGYGIQEEEG